MNEAVSKAKRCELCPPDEETCYCYDDKPSVYLTESQLDEIVKEFVKPAVSEDDRRLKMTVLSLVSDLRNCRAELAEERAAHNAHVTELCEMEQERDMYKDSSEVFYERLKIRDELLEQLHAQIKYYFGGDGGLAKLQDGVNKLLQERQKLIECLLFYERLTRGREINDGGRRARTLLAEIGVKVE